MDEHEPVFHLVIVELYPEPYPNWVQLLEAPLTPAPSEEWIKSYRRDIKVMNTTEYDLARKHLAQYAARRGARYHIRTLVENLTEDEILILCGSCAK